jgi:hypothetical protein
MPEDGLEDMDVVRQYLKALYIACEKNHGLGLEDQL